MKIRPVGDVLFHADGRMVRYTDRQTDTTKLIVAFHNFMKIRPVGDVLFHADGRMDGWSDIQTDKQT